jgi:hypothetical protein
MDEIIIVLTYFLPLFSNLHHFNQITYSLDVLVIIESYTIETD